MLLQQNGTFYSMHKNYYSSTNNRVILPACVTIFWPTKHYHIRKRFSLLSTFWKTIWALLGCKLKFSTTFHPQMDGQIEVVNRVLFHALRTHFGCSKQSDNYLHILQHSYNKATHSSTRFSSFEVCLGFQSASPAEPPLTLAPQGTMHQQKEQISTQRFLQQISLRHTAVTTTLKETQDQDKRRHDKQRKFLTFQPRDKVWLHLDKKCFKGQHHKLLPIRYGPYSILDKIGENAYRLDLPPQLGIHNVIKFQSSEVV